MHGAGQKKEHLHQLVKAHRGIRRSRTLRILVRFIKPLRGRKEITFIGLDSIHPP